MGFRGTLRSPGFSKARSETPGAATEQPLGHLGQLAELDGGSWQNGPDSPKLAAASHSMALTEVFSRRFVMILMPSLLQMLVLVSCTSEEHYIPHHHHLRHVRFGSPWMLLLR